MLAALLCLGFAQADPLDDAIAAGPKALAEYILSQAQTTGGGDAFASFTADLFNRLNNNDVRDSVLRPSVIAQLVVLVANGDAPGGTPIPEAVKAAVETVIEGLADTEETTPATPVP